MSSIMDKFEQIFGIKLDPDEAKYAGFPCSCTRSNFCDKHICTDYPTKNFWTKEYVEKNKLDHGRDGVDSQVEDFWW